MAETVGDIAVRVGADVSGITSGMSKAGDSLDKFGGRVSTTTKLMVGLTASLAATAAAAVVAATSQIDLADKTMKASQAAGISTQEFSKLSYAMSLGVDGGGDLANTMKFLNKAIAAAGDGTKANVEDFTRMGIAYKNADGTLRSSADVMLDISEKFSLMKDGAEKTAFALAFFGKSGADMVPFLNQGKQSIVETMQEAEKFGKVIGPEFAKNSEKFNDNLTRMKAIISGTSAGLTEAILPALVELSDRIIAAAGGMDEFKANLAAVGKVVEVLAGALIGRLIFAAGASVVAFVAATAQSIAYQVALARMAGQAGATAVALAGLKTVASTMLGVFGGPVGLALTIAGAAVALIDFSKWSGKATLTASEFNSMIAETTGNLKEMNKVQFDNKLSKLMDEMLVRQKQIVEINDQAAKSNANLGKGETERIAALQGQLTQLAVAYKTVQDQKAAAMAEPAASPGFTPAAASSGGGSDGKAAAEAKALADRQTALANEIEAELWAEGEKQAQKDQMLREGAAKELARLDQQYMTEQERLAQKFEEENAIIAAAREAGISTKDELDARELQAMMAHESALSEIAKRETDQRIEQAKREAANKKAILGDAMNALTSLMNSGSRKMFEVGKIASISQAIVSTITGATKALELGWPLGPMAAAAITAGGMSNVANIRRQTFGGGGSVGATSMPTANINAAATGTGGGSAASGPSQRSNVTLVGDYFGREAVIGLLHEAFKDGFTLSGA